MSEYKFRKLPCEQCNSIASVCDLVDEKLCYLCNECNSSFFVTLDECISGPPQTTVRIEMEMSDRLKKAIENNLDYFNEERLWKRLSDEAPNSGKSLLIRTSEIFTKAVYNDTLGAFLVTVPDQSMKLNEVAFFTSEVEWSYI